MATPTSGYDLTKQLGSAIKRAENAALSAIGTSTSTQNTPTRTGTGSAPPAGMELAKNALTSAAKNVSEKLQQQLGNKLNKVNAIASGAGKLSQLAGNASLSKVKLGGLAGKFAQATGKITKKGGLGNILSGTTSGDAIADAATASTQLINAKLADTLFTALPTDSILAVDAYGVKDNGTLNNIIGKLSGFANNLLGGGGLQDIGRDLTRMVLSTDKLSLNTDALKDRLLMSLGGKSGIVDSLSRSMRDGLAALGLPPQVYDSIETTIMDVTRYQSSSNVQSAQQLFGLIDRVTGDPELATFLDVGAEATLLSTIFREALDLGVPDTIDAMLTKANSSEAAYYALQSNIIVASDLGELKTLDTMITQLGASRVLADCPDAIARVLSNYKFVPGTTFADYAELFTQMNAVFSKLDAQWGYYDRDGEQVTDMTVFENVSADARTLLSSIGPFQLVIMLAGSYPSRELLDLSKQNYPFVVV